MLLVCLLLLVGCGSNFRSYFLGDADVTVNDSANGRHIQISTGQVLDIVLSDDYETSHCHWHDDQRYDVRILEGAGFKYSPGQTAPGTARAGTDTLRYRARSAGTVHVALMQQDSASPPHVFRSFAVDVTVS